MKRIAFAVGFILVFSRVAVSQAEISCTKPVKTTAGLVSGKADQETDTCAWLGVPYAAAPVGELRWSPPQPPKPWSGVLKATEFGPPCVQYGGMMAIMDCEKIGELIGDEDCLYLNIWRPRNDEKDLPVFFWIHGGGNVVGQSAMSLYHGARFAKGADMVFVSINYRLGPMGWFTHPALRTGDPIQDSGNYGTLDMLQALKWVRDNIKAFGGDPDNVTIAGESAGGVNVYSLLASPLAKGLFHRAIVQSGAPLTSSLEEGEKESERVLSELLVKDGLAPELEKAKQLARTKDKKWIADYLRGKSKEEIFGCYRAGLYGSPSGSHQVFVDGTVIPDSPLKLFKSGNYNRVPVLAGYNREELKLFLSPVMSRMNEAELCRFFREYDPEGEEVKMGDLMKPIYWPLYPLYNPIARGGAKGFQYLGVTRPFRAMSKHQDELYAYKFAWDEEPKPFDFAIGAAHALEMPFVFGNFDQDPDSALRFAWTEENRAAREELSRRMMSYWANFAKTGNPNGPGLPEWPRWTEKRGGKRLLLLDTEQ